MNRKKLFKLFLFVDILAILICILNFLWNEPVQLFYYDLLSGFSDNSSYRIYIFKVITILLLIYAIVSVLLRGISLKWTVEISGIGKFTYMNGQFINRRLLGTVVITVNVFFLVHTIWNVYSYYNNRNLWKGDSTIAHSLGAIDGITGTGTLEAFQESYANGHRTFEVDFSITSDGKIVLVHDWETWTQLTLGEIKKEYIPTEKEFKSTPILGRYTPLTFVDICRLMQKYPDIWIITDSKETQADEIKNEFEKMLVEAKKIKATDVFDRFVVQIYNENMFSIVNDIYPFKSYIFTLYMRWGGQIDEFSDICRWCVINNINAITMWNYLSDDDNLFVAKRYGLDVYVHTENDRQTAIDFLRRGIKGVYTDTLIPAELQD